MKSERAVETSQNVIDQRTDGSIRVPSVSEEQFVDGRLRIQDALRRLASCASTESVERVAPLELVEACGFTRAMVSAVRGTKWIPLHLHSRGELDPEAEGFRSYVRGNPEIPLANMLAETDMVRRRASVLVDDSLVRTRAFKPIIEIARSPGYVAAPIVVDGRTIGFVHADRVGQSRSVDEFDRRFVQAFTGELAVLCQRVALAEKLSERHKHVCTELERASDSLIRIDTGSNEVTFSPNVEPLSTMPFDQTPSDALLTKREWEILGHVADGATNGAIADRLSITENTVKSHLRSVLRKFRVTTRGAAVARYLETASGSR